MGFGFRPAARLARALATEVGATMQRERSKMGARSKVLKWAHLYKWRFGVKMHTNADDARVSFLG